MKNNSITLDFTIVFWKIKKALEAKNKDGTQKYKYIILKGSSRSSKTISLCDIFDLEARTKHNRRLTIWRETKTLCKKTVLADLIKHHKRTGRYKLDYEYNKTESILYYTHGGKDETSSTIEIQGTDDDEAVHGFEQDWAWINEPYKMSPDTFDQIDMRSSVVFLDYNPKKKTLADSLSKKENAIVIHSTFRDNPFCPSEQRIKILSYQPVKYCRLVIENQESASKIFSFKDRQALKEYLSSKKYSSNKVNEAVRCFQNELVADASEYKWKVYGLGEKAENPKKIHSGWISIPSREYEKLKASGDYPVYYGLDYGFSVPTACVEIMYDGDRTFYLKQILYKPINQMSKPLGEELRAAGVPAGDVTYIFADSQDKDVKSGVSMTSDLRSYHSLNVIPVQKPTYLERFEYMQKCIIVYTSDSINIEAEYDTYEWHYINGESTEKPIKADDHLMNAIEYAMWMIKILHKLNL
ncbi:hypothetical protein GNY06_05040 [Elizabethkingia argentiflava]|uniref:Phage terminase large subunit N-terminal domain-containing protein n=1 Tax=Elizabethkingia argenteiflava TaxID=2681556 RepID=A0A845PUK3_9FLAO|nr:phage terminase large subunit [Elizabethkingia argenteiflava]NAW50773.1 hypothetical protein [Elizabethkingia argenteiflava]